MNDDSFKTFEEEEGKHHHPVVPEPEYYGLFLMVILSGFMAWRKFKR